MRVITWNLWWRYGPWLEREPGIIAELREVDADLMALQEVWAEEGRTQADVLGDELGFHRGYAPTRSYGREQRPDHAGIGSGIAVLSRWPIRSVSAHTLPSRPGDPPPGRIADRWVGQAVILAEITSPHGVIHLCTTTLDPEPDRSQDRQAQAKELLRLLPSQDAVIVTGDLNAEPDTPEIRLLNGGLADVWQTGPGGTHSGRRIDYIMISDTLSATRAWLAGTSERDGVLPSDHAAVVAEISPV